MIANLSTPIDIHVPLNKMPDFSNPNYTLGCGYIDPVEQIFKQDGFGTLNVDNKTVICSADHLTPVAVEQYFDETLANSS